MCCSTSITLRSPRLVTYERPQAGRYRQLQQVGVEAIGVDDPPLDAEVIAVADAGFRSLGCLDRIGARVQRYRDGHRRCEELGDR